MKRLCVLVALLMSLGLTGVAFAMPIGWDVVVGGSVVTGNSITINPDNNWIQRQGLHGGGFVASGPEVNFDVSAWTWDAYSADAGLYDVFVVNINQDGYVFDDPWFDPVTSASYMGGTVTDTPSLAGNSIAWGGESWCDRQLETLTGNFSLSLDDYNPTKEVFVSVFWKTDYDSLFGSGGTVIFNNAVVAPVPEPATMLLFGTGLAGLAGFTNKKRKKE